MISVILVCLAAICNAVMDTLAHHFYVSIFKDKNPKFWNPDISWKEAQYAPLTRWKFDAWHLFKSIMIILLCIAICLSPSWIDSWLDKLVYLILLGVVWNVVFSWFYNTVLKAKASSQ